MKKAIVTLAVGEKYEASFNKSCRSLWTKYAEKHQSDLIVFTRPLDTSQKAQSRNVSWQKCLILSSEQIKSYDQVAWVDSDILINPDSPDIFEDVPIEKIGVVDEYSIPSKEEHQQCLRLMYQHWSSRNITFMEDLTATDYHKNFGLSGEFNSVAQGGVIVFSPAHHRNLMEHIYHAYEDKGQSFWHYEMRPLSYEIQSNKLEHWISPKFNMIWNIVKHFQYPFLEEPYNTTEKLLYKLRVDPRAKLFSKCISAAFMNNYFLHFAGNSRDMQYFDTRIVQL